MKRSSDHWIFESGTSRYAHTEALGITHRSPLLGPLWEISYGSDGRFWSEGEERWSEEKPELTNADLIELAEHQIERWQKFKRWCADRVSGSEPR